MRPVSDNNREEILLLLGLPWFYTIYAKIRIKDSIIQIGDKKTGESFIDLKVQKLVDSEGHKLALCQDKNTRQDYFEDTDSSSNDSEELDSDSDDDDE